MQHRNIEEAARHDAPTLPDDGAPPARWWCLGLVFAGCVGWLAVVGLVAMGLKEWVG